LWVPRLLAMISPQEGTHKGCPYDLSTMILNSYETLRLRASGSSERKY
jgi:hypothetical protein